MGRPSKLTPAQWDEVARRAAEGEGIRALAREFGVDEAAIRRRVSPQTPQVRSVAVQLVEAQKALAALPPPQQHLAMSLADKLRSISLSYASAAELGAKTAHRFHALANMEAQKVDDANPLSPDSVEAMKGIAIMTKLGNDALVPAASLLAANKPTVERLNQERPAVPQIDPTKLSSSALQELLDARSAGAF